MKRKQTKIADDRGYTLHSIRACQQYMLHWLNIYLKDVPKEYREDYGIDPNIKYNKYRHLHLYQYDRTADDYISYSYDKHYQEILGTNFLLLASWLEIPESEAIDILRNAEKLLIFNTYWLNKLNKLLCVDATNVVEDVVITPSVQKVQKKFNKNISDIKW